MPTDKTGSGDDVALDETAISGGGGTKLASGTGTGTPRGGQAATGPRRADYPALMPVDPEHYVIDGELARGGMGRVLAARDRRLGRPVAIKELLHQDADLLRRFEREARVTARLQHPAIVNVHEAGVWASHHPSRSEPRATAHSPPRDGEPFYVMKLISGRSLDKIIAEQKTLAARLALVPNVLAVADALAYAHSQRVIHRDLKPANVVVGDFGETVVLDWGLAKELGQAEDPADATATAQTGTQPTATASSPDSGTVAGALMGTPAYMAPEQVQGDPVDERTDVYAIGAILYQTLAGDLPYRADDLQSMLFAITTGPPPPLAQRAPGTPADLAAIVEKAMATNPAHRYPTALELAADLRSFQTGKLVASHTYTRRQLLRRFLRRNRAAVGVAAALLVVLGVMATISVRQIVKERDVAQAQRALAEQRKQQADRRRTRAEGLVEFMISDLKERLEPIGKISLLEPVGEAVVGYYDSAEAGDEEADGQERRAAALVLLGDMRYERGEIDAGLRLHEQALRIREGLRAAAPDQQKRQLGVARSLREVGTGQLAKGDVDGAEASFLAALAIDEQLPADDGEVLSDHARTQERLGILALRRGNVTEAERRFQASHDLRLRQHTLEPESASRRGLALSHARLGEVAMKRGDRDAALAAFEASLALSRALVDEEPTNATYQSDLAHAWTRIGELHEERRDWQAAERAYTAGRDLREELARRDPDNAEWQLDLAVAYDRLGNAAREQGRKLDALALYRKAVAVVEAVVSRHTDHPSYRRNLAATYAKLARELLDQGDHAGAETICEKALAIFVELIAAAPDDPNLRADQASVLSMLGALELDRGNDDEALVAFEQALAARLLLVERDPENVRWQRNLATSWLAVGQIHLRKDRWARAADAYRSAAAVYTRVLEKGDDPKVRGQLANVWARVGEAEVGRGDRAAAAEAHRRALALREALVKEAPDDERRLALARSLRDVAALSEPAEARRLRQQGLTVLTGMIGDDAAELRRDLRR